MAAVIGACSHAGSGPIRDRVEAGQRGFLGILGHLIEVAEDNGELSPATNSEQMSFELHPSLELANFLSTPYRDRSLIERATARREGQDCPGCGAPMVG